VTKDGVVSTILIDLPVENVAASAEIPIDSDATLLRRVFVVDNTIQAVPQYEHSGATSVTEQTQ